MVAGRVVWGAVSFLLYGLGDTAFSWEMFMGGAFLKALPGIAIQLVLIPIIVMALNKNKEKDNTLSA
jgi:cbb3-type cytochrome oxidase subunit 3